MDDSVEYHVSYCGITLKGLVPTWDGHLADDDGGLSAVPFLDDFHQVKYLLGVEPLHAEVIEYELVGLCDPFEETR